jgi:hypothetical protein
MIGKALDLQITQYKELWNEVQEFGATSMGKSESDRWILYFERFGLRVDSSRLIISLLVCSYLEAMANYYLSLKTDVDQFALLERASLLEKWIIIPRFFNPEYRLPKNGQLYQDLKLLISERNVIVHSKPLIKIDGVIVHKGNTTKNLADGHKITLRSASLPERLLKFLWKYDKSTEVNLLVFSCGYNLAEFNSD